MKRTLMRRQVLKIVGGMALSPWPPPAASAQADGVQQTVAALLAGFAAGYIVQFLKKITEKLPASLNGIRPMLIYPLGGILIIGAVMCGINPVMGIINDFITNWLNSLGGTSAILLGAVSAVMMSIDMGGPFNKAAYVFGTAALASGNYEVMAAVMVGGMVPPIAIALSTTFCPKKWTPDERRNGIVNYVMGLCFVTEGAIPYAAADPLRVLPSCVAGAALASITAWHLPTPPAPADNAAAFVENRLPQQRSDGESLGFSVLGPLAASFCQWLHARRAARPEARLYFLARDMYLMRDVYHTLYPQEETGYLQVSRRSLAPAFLAAGDWATVLAALPRQTLTGAQIAEYCGTTCPPELADRQFDLKQPDREALHAFFRQLPRPDAADECSLRCLLRPYIP